MSRDSIVSDAFRSGASFAAQWKSSAPDTPSVAPAGSADNPLWQHFEKNTVGAGIWKWTHYFDPYHRHLARMASRPVVVVEIGIFSGGSLPMWKKYFGPDSHVIGIDIEPACRAYEAEGISVVIGDQADRNFWRTFRESHPHVDVVIDDGGHTPEQQRVTLEEMLPHLRPGGIYICEDIHYTENEFAAFAAGLVGELNARIHIDKDVQKSRPSPFQRDIYAIHFYAYLLVIEKSLNPPTELMGPRHGTEWQPFL